MKFFFYLFSIFQFNLHDHKKIYNDEDDDDDHVTTITTTTTTS